MTHQNFKSNRLIGLRLTAQYFSGFAFCRGILKKTQTNKNNQFWINPRNNPCVLVTR